MADQIIRLTDAQKSQSSFALFTKPVSFSKGLSVTFNFYAYGGTGGDGFSFFLLDAAKGLPTTSGGTGGSLGYAPLNDTKGIAGGYLGIGFDELGNYSSPTEGRRGGPGTIPNAIAVRGSEQNNYRYLVGTDSLPFPLDFPGRRVKRKQAEQTALVQLSPQGILSISIDVNKDGDFSDRGEAIIQDFNVGRGGNEAVPRSLLFGFAGATGEQTNIHEVSNFKVTTFAGRRIRGDFSKDVLVLGTEEDDVLTGGGNNDVIQGLGGNDLLRGENGNDTLIGGSGTDTLLGGNDNDILVSGIGSDTMTGGQGADRFVFSGLNAKSALKTSVVAESGRDLITDFKQRAGDRFQLDFDGNYQNKGRAERPRTLYNAGKINAGNLQDAVKAVYADVIPSSRKPNPLRVNQAAIFKFEDSFFLTVNGGKVGFSAKTDLVADIGQLRKKDFAPGDFDADKLSVTDYFI